MHPASAEPSTRTAFIVAYMEENNIPPHKRTLSGFTHDGVIMNAIPREGDWANCSRWVMVDASEAYRRFVETISPGLHGF